MTTEHRLEKSDWHTLQVGDVFSKLESQREGLSQREAQSRLDRLGPNVLPEQPSPAWWMIFLRQFYNPLIFVLGAAAIVAIAIGDWTDAGFIGAVLLLNSMIGGYQEWRAEQSSRALQKMLHVRATVIRDGTNREMDAELVVPGDVLLLESGNRVPADVRLLTTQSLQIDESFLTGESLAVTKDSAWVGPIGASVGDHQNMGYAGAVVTRGRGKGVVVQTGANTLVGQLAESVAGAETGTAPLLERMEGFARLIALVVLVVATVIGGAGVAIHGVGELKNIFLFTVALAVAAIPEGLPAALTVALSIATARMAKRGVIVRRLAAVEGLGSCTLVASDKTGTLTCNELTVRVVVLSDGTRVDVSGQGFEPIGDVTLDGQAASIDTQADLGKLVLAGVLCNEADLYRHEDQWKWRGDATDIALLALGEKLGESRDRRLREFPLVHQIPFEAEHRYAATYHRDADRTRVFVKGAAERLLEMSDLSPGRRVELSVTTEGLAAEGYRVLAIASGTLADDVDPDSPVDELHDLQFHGFIGMIDPLRPGVVDSIAACHRAGIRVCMITGDHPVTASAIARQLGIADRDGHAVTGVELEGLDESAINDAVRNHTVFARVAPQQKLDLVRAAQSIGHFVAVTGDGVNDAPALRAANIGVAMGKEGTDVAREAAELVVSDDDFSSIVNGIEEGRVAYDNVRKVVAQLTATGTAEVILVCMTLAAGGIMMLLDFDRFVTEGAILLPLLPVQLLWLNLVTNGIQGVALAFEPNEGDVLTRRPRPPAEPVFNRLMIERTLVAASVMAFVSFGMFFWALWQGMQAAAASNLLLLLMVLFENVHVGNNRSETKSALAFSPLRSPYLLAGVLGALSIHILAMNLPLLQQILRTEPVSLQTWAVLAGLASTIFIAMEIHKISWRRRYPKQ
ncbi:MAG TPA: ATPase [Planctomycetaceae bacterium]|nr:ATPase [Planctomycetaceae bacterium]